MLLFNLSFGIEVALRQALMHIERSWRAERSFAREKIYHIERSQARIPTCKRDRWLAWRSHEANVGVAQQATRGKLWLRSALQILRWISMTDGTSFRMLIIKAVIIGSDKSAFLPSMFAAKVSIFIWSFMAFSPLSSLPCIQYFEFGPNVHQGKEVGTWEQLSPSEW